jgi:hypothetical protein
MAGSRKANKNLWHGYLQAGANSSPVLRDDSLDTGNSKTLYLFNLERGRILEYSREIVENKLRELKGKESRFVAKLDAGYAEARRSFKDRSSRILNIPEHGDPQRKPAKPREKRNFDDVTEEPVADVSWLDA